MTIDERLDGELDLLWRGLQAELQEQRPGRSRRRAGMVAGVVAGSLVVGGAAAATGLLHAHTGRYTHGWEVQAGGPGEELDMDAPDYPAVLRSIVADIPFAPDYGSYRTYTITVLLAPHPAGGPEAITTSTARGIVADQAICSWADSWVAADRARRHAARARATRALTGALHWRAVLDLDPHPSPDGARRDGGGTAPTRFGYLPGLGAAARDGDERGVIEAVAPPGGTQCVPKQLRAIERPS